MDIANLTTNANGIALLPLSVANYAIIDVRTSYLSKFSSFRGLSGGQWYAVVENFDGTRVTNSPAFDVTIYYIEREYV